jgi:hypothetical protein
MCLTLLEVYHNNIPPELHASAGMYVLYFYICKLFWYIRSILLIIIQWMPYLNFDIALTSLRSNIHNYLHSSPSKVPQ